MASDQRANPTSQDRSLIAHGKHRDNRQQSRPNPENVIKLGSHPGNKAQVREKTLDCSGLTRSRSSGVHEGLKPRPSHQSASVATKHTVPPVCSNSGKIRVTPGGSLNQQNSKSGNTVRHVPSQPKPKTKSISLTGSHLKSTSVRNNSTEQIAKKNKTAEANKQTNNRAVKKVSADKQEKKDSKTKIPVLHNSTISHQYEEHETLGAGGKLPHHSDKPTLGGKRSPSHSGKPLVETGRKFNSQADKSFLGTEGYNEHGAMGARRRSPSQSDQTSLDTKRKPPIQTKSSCQGARGKSPSHSDKSSHSSENKGSMMSVESLEGTDAHLRGDCSGGQDTHLRRDCLEIKLSSSHSLQRKSSSTRSLRIHSGSNGGGSRQIQGTQSGSNGGGSRQILASSAQKRLQEKKGPAQGSSTECTKKNTEDRKLTSTENNAVLPGMSDSGTFPTEVLESKVILPGVSESSTFPVGVSEQTGTKKCPCLLSRTLGKNNQNSGKVLVPNQIVGDLVSNGNEIPNQKGDVPIEERLGMDEESSQSKHISVNESLSWPDQEADDVLDWYPEPDVSSSQWTSLDNEDLSKIANHVLKVTPQDATSFDLLLSYLCHDLKSDLSRVRAIFCWIVSQQLPVIDDVREIPPQETPLGSLYQITQGLRSYSQVFCKMCRCVEIPCVVIHGISKGVMYNVGDVMSKEKHSNSWNAVYVEDTWRFVHCHWASRSARGYTSGNWVTVDCPEFRTDNIEGESRSYIVSSLINDYYFFTDPSIFIHKCFPFDQRWQLLSKKCSKTEFESCPFLQPAFYALNLRLVDEMSCVSHTRGKYVLRIRMPPAAVNRLRFTYNLYRLRNSQDEGEYDYPSLERFTLHYCVGDVAFFEVRFPPLSVGDFRLQVFCSDDQICLPSEWICDFKIVCEKGMDVSVPLPVVPRIGWGKNSELAKHGIALVSHTDGLYSLDTGAVCFKFVFPLDVESHAELLKHKSSRSEYTDYVTVEKKGGNVSVKVEAPCPGEFALQIFCQQKGSLNYVNVCNYLLERSVFAESRTCYAVRKNLTSCILRNDVTIKELSDILEDFLRCGVADRGEVEAARKKLIQLQLKEDLQAAIKCRSLDKLEKALQEVKASDQACVVDMNNDISKGEKLLTHLKRLKRFRMAVLEMDSQTIAELRSYVKPPLAVHGVMVATYVLLGVDEKELRHWSGIQSLIGKTGKEGLKRRVANFDVRSVRKGPLQRAREILRPYDLTLVQEASAGAATFYLWAINMINDIEEQNCG